MAHSSKRQKMKVDYQLLNSIGRSNESQDMDLDLSQLLVKDNNEETSFHENITRPTENITSTNDAPKSKHSTESSDSDCDLDAEIARLTIQKQKLKMCLTKIVN